MLSLAKAPSKASARHFPLLRCCTRFLLTRGSQPELIPATFESIYTACCSQVKVPGQGEMLYEMLVMEIDQCNARLLRELEASRDAGNLVDWLGKFVQACEWFETRVVRRDQLFGMSFATRLMLSLVSGHFTVVVILLGSCFHLKGPEASEHPVSG